jgi:hypothetical protein
MLGPTLSSPPITLFLANQNWLPFLYITYILSKIFKRPSSERFPNFSWISDNPSQNLWNYQCESIISSPLVPTGQSYLWPSLNLCSTMLEKTVNIALKGEGER